MDTLEIVIIAVVAVLLLLALGGAVVVRRRREATHEQFTASIDQVNRDLAAAHAADNGWEPSLVQGAARDAFAREHPGAEPSSIELVQVIDRPGTDDDKAVFRIAAADGVHHLTLGRRSGEWVLDTLD